MKIKALSIGLIILSLILAGCGTGTTEPVEWHKGTEGVTIAFVSDSPPNILYNGESDYEVVLEAFNKGTYDADIEIHYTGYDSDILSIDDTDSLSLTGKTDTDRTGEFGYTDGNTFDVTLPESVDVLRPTLKATACYEYETDATVQVCIDPSPTKDLGDTCSPGAQNVGGGQGAPVAITNVQVENLKEAARFRITIQNVGNGAIIERDFVDSCIDPAEFTNTKLNKVEILEAELGETSLDCKPEDIVKLTGGERADLGATVIAGTGTLTCTAEGLDNTGSYVTSLHLKLGYGYRTSITKQLEVRAQTQ